MSATITISHPRPEDWAISVVETSVSNGETIEISPGSTEKFPKMGRVVRVQFGLLSGTATKAAPILATASSFYADQVVVESGLAVEGDDSIPDGIPYFLSGDALYHRSNPNAGSDNVVRTLYLIKEGW